MLFQDGNNELINNQMFQVITESGYKFITDEILMQHSIVIIRKI